MQIGEVAQKTGLSRDTLRYYEKFGLIRLSKKDRGENNYRIYDDSIIQKIGIILQLKEAGFTLNEIKDLFRREELDLLSCNSIAPLIQNKLQKIEQKIKMLEAQKTKLLTATKACQGDCLEALSSYRGL